MDVNEAIYLLRQLGLTLTVNNGRLDIAPADLLDDDARWLIRRHRDALVELIDAEADMPWRGWLLHFSDSAPLEAHCNPAALHAEILERYPDALAAEPIPEHTRHTPTEAEAAELSALDQTTH